MNTIPTSAYSAIRNAAAAIAEATNANEPAHADAMALLTEDLATWDAHAAEWALDTGCEATAEHTEDGFENPEVRNLVDRAIQAIQA